MTASSRVREPSRGRQADVIDPFMPIVESLMKHPLDSPEFADALAVAGPPERAEARRQIETTMAAYEDRNDEIERRMRELADE